jgi:hypothetical protein
MAVIDVVTFRLAPGVDEEEFLDADQRAQTEVFYAQPGLLRRTTARAGAGGDWLVLTLWASPGDADASADASRDTEEVSRWMACIEPPSVTTRRYATLD